MLSQSLDSKFCRSLSVVMPKDVLLLLLLAVVVVLLPTPPVVRLKGKESAEKGRDVLEVRGPVSWRRRRWFRWGPCKDLLKEGDAKVLCWEARKLCRCILPSTLLPKGDTEKEEGERKERFGRGTDNGVAGAGGV